MASHETIGHMCFSSLTNRREANRQRMRSRRAARTIATAALMSLFVSELFLATAPSSIWMGQRSCRWWEDVLLQSFQNQYWIENFQVRRNTFVYLCYQLKPAIEKQNNTMRQCVSLEHRIAITLWVLATTFQYRTVRHLFGVAKKHSQFDSP